MTKDATASAKFYGAVVGWTFGAPTESGGVDYRMINRNAPKVPGYFLYFPSAARKAGPPRLFVETLRELGLPAAPPRQR